MIDRLKVRVKAGLTNAQEVVYSDELYLVAINECEEIVKNKAIALAFKLDIAYYRFLMLVDVVPNERDEKNYSLAIKQLSGAISMDGSSKKINIIVGSRSSEW
jgi:hypothetical protein